MAIGSAKTLRRVDILFKKDMNIAKVKSGRSEGGPFFENQPVFFETHVTGLVSVRLFAGMMKKEFVFTNECFNANFDEIV